MTYSTVNDVLDATGLSVAIIKELSGKNETEINTMIQGFIQKADGKIKRFLGIPITVRKEYHSFKHNLTVELGPYEDEFEFFSAYDPTDCVEKVFAIYRQDERIKLPYPKNCDALTESSDGYTGSNCTISEDTNDKKAGEKSIKAVFSDAGYFLFAEKLNKKLYPWEYIGFWFKTSDETVTFTLTLIDKDGNTASKEFTLDVADDWQIVSLKISDFCDDIDWKKTPVYGIKISADKSCTVHFDNFNFNDGIFWTTPKGLICWSDPEIANPIMEFEVTYSYDPFKLTTPPELIEASAKMAGVLLIDFMIGCRQRIAGFEQMADTLDPRPDRETLEITRSRLLREAEQCLAAIGYRTYEGIG